MFGGRRGAAETLGTLSCQLKNTLLKEKRVLDFSTGLADAKKNILADASGQYWASLTRRVT